MIPVYNAANFLPLALESVLNQIPANYQAQIEVVDDASTDANIEEIVNSLGKGQVSYFRQAENVGSLRNFETCINRAKGHYIHLLHADDLVEPGYYAKITQLFEQNPEAGAAFTRYYYIDDKGLITNEKEIITNVEGVIPGYLEILGYQQKQQYCITTVKRSVYEHLGSFYGVTYGEDWEMWLRIAKHYPVAYSPKFLGSYRLHYNSISGQAFVSGKNIRDLQWVFSKTLAHLPGNKGIKAVKYARFIYAYHALNIANRLWHGKHDKASAKAQIKAALKLDKKFILYWRALKLYIKMFIGRK